MSSYLAYFSCFGKNLGRGNLGGDSLEGGMSCADEEMGSLRVFSGSRCDSFSEMGICLSFSVLSSWSESRVVSPWRLSSVEVASGECTVGDGTASDGGDKRDS